MKLITRDTDYALRAICKIAKEKGKVLSVKELTGLTKVPGPYLRKILQRLNKAGVLISHKGTGGGFKLARGKVNTRLFDLIVIFQGHFKLNECFFKKEKCPDTGTCPLKKRIDKIEKNVIKELKEITIASLLR